MDVYLDTSAIVPLLLQEPHSGAAKLAIENASSIWAWRWAKVETEAALVRRKANPLTWRNWRILESEIRWLESSEGLIEGICRFNRELGLRAADAGHLFILERSVAVIEEFMLVTFDNEMSEAAHALGLRVFIEPDPEG